MINLACSWRWGWWEQWHWIKQWGCTVLNQNKLKDKKKKNPKPQSLEILHCRFITTTSHSKHYPSSKTHHPDSSARWEYQFSWPSMTHLYPKVSWNWYICVAPAYRMCYISSREKSQQRWPGEIEANNEHYTTSWLELILSYQLISWQYKMIDCCIFHNCTFWWCNGV